MSVTKSVVLGVFVLLIAAIGFDAWYIVPEGHVGIEKRFGKAVLQTDPGLRWKVPFIDAVEQIEVRQRKNTEKLASSTQNQLPITAEVSINWTVHKDAAMQLFVEYGGLAQFETRVLDPKLRSSAKAAIARFPADQLIRNRAKAVDEILQELIKTTEGLPITINSPQIENISLPPSYLEAIMEKERAREAAEREKHNLNKQKLVAQQEVQSAEATRDATMAKADGDAYKTRITAEAEGFRVLTEYTERAKGVALLKNQLTAQYIAYLRAQTWDGAFPSHVLANGMEVLLGMGLERDKASQVNASK